jgi:hypothetical protein
MAVTTANYGWIDHSAESSRTRLNFPEIESDGSNYENITGATGNIELMRVAVQAVSKLNETRVTMSQVLHTAVGTIPADATAQREMAARMTYVDNVTNKKYRFDIPAPDDAYVPTGSDDINMAAAVWVTFKTAFDSLVVSPDGNAVTLLSGRIIGRRS